VRPTEQMTSLLVQSCSATKQNVDSPTPVLDLYEGYFFKIIKKALRTNRFQAGIDIIIISAEHGVLEPDEEIGYYDRKMDAERADELNPKIINYISNRVSRNKYDRIWINLGEDYLPAVDGIESAVDVSVDSIQGNGIGMKGKRLKRLISSGQSAPVHGD